MSRQKAIFLDRDGVINDNSIAYYIYQKEKFVLNEGVIDSLKILQSKGYIFIVITNQGGIAKGLYNNQDVRELNAYLVDTLKNEGIIIQEIFHCPHHSDISKCLCRKPGSLLFEKAIAQFHIDSEQSFMIGDSDRDIVAAERVGLKGIKVKANGNLFESIKNTEYSHLLA